MRFRLVWLLPALLAATLTCPPAYAQSSRLRIHFGFDGVAKDGLWAPVLVEVTGEGQEIRGTLDLPVQRPDGHVEVVYRRPIVVGARSRQIVPFYVRPSVAMGEVRVRLWSDRAMHADEKISPGWRPATDALIVVAGRERGSLSFLSGALRPPPAVPPPPASYSYSYVSSGQIRVADVDPELLPDAPHGFDAVDLLVIGQLSARAFRPETLSAIHRWVLSGGTLVVTGGADWARLGDPFFRRLLPVRPTGARTVGQLSALQAEYGDALVGPAVVTQAAPLARARVKLAQGDLPLIVERPLGAGLVVFLAFDAALPPLRGWAGQGALWNDLLVGGGGDRPLLSALNTGSSYGPPSPSQTIAAALLGVPGMRTPPFWWLALFLAGYVLLLVPVNYGVLRWLRRQELAWVTTPAIILLFMVLAYGVSYATKGGVMQANQVNLLEVAAGSRQARLVSLAGIFSPARTAYEIEPPAGCHAVSEIRMSNAGSNRPLEVTEGDPPVMTSVPFDMWSMRVFRLESTVPVDKGFDGLVVVDSRGTSGWVRNDSGYELRDAFLQLGRTVTPVGNIAPGQTVQLAAAVPAPAQSGMVMHLGSGVGNPPGAPRSPAKTRDALRRAVEQAFDRSGRSTGNQPVLTGWLERPLPGPSVDGHTLRPTSVTFVAVRLPLAAGKGWMSFPDTLLDSALVESRGLTPEANGEWQIDGGGYAIRQYRLPPTQGSLQVARLQVGISAPGPAATSLDLWNWHTGAWEDTGIGAGRGTIEGRPEYVKLPEGLVKVRVAYQPPHGGPPLRLSGSTLIVEGLVQ